MMEEVLELDRFAKTEMGVFGGIVVAGQRLVTVERPWLNNLPGVSCIPPGEYECRPQRFNAGGYDAVEVCNVPGRTHILFHRGNTMFDVKGCIAIGSRLGVVNGLWAALDSKPAFALFMEHYNRPFRLRVQGCA